MSYLSIKGMGNGTTAVSNTFIDQYMITESSTHLKTYLMLLRMLGQNPDEITVAEMADRLDCGESDVLRSLKHWEKKGLMTLEFSEDGSTLCGLVMYDPDAVSEQRSGSARKAAKRTAEKKMQERMQTKAEPEKTSGPETSAAEVLPDKNVDLDALSSDESYCQLIYVAETFLGRPLTHTDCETFAWLYDKLKMNTDLLEYLVEYCVHNKHTSVRYMEAVAIDWHQKKIETVEQAKIYTPLNGQKIYAIMKALGLNNRQPAQSERQVIDGWFTKYGFSVDMIVEACDRTMISIHEPNLKYVESILSRWKDAGISRLDQVKQLDEDHQKEMQSRASGGKNAGSGASKNARTRNGKAGAAMKDFEQRSYDYDALMQQLNQAWEKKDQARETDNNDDHSGD